MRGYGQLVIIDHGEDCHSLMAHLGQVAVRAGQQVEPGETIGAVGDTGSVRGTRLHFEIRRKGVPQDPLKYLVR